MALCSPLLCNPTILTPCRLWKSGNARRETLRVVVLDEKRREEVQKLVSLVYTLAEVRSSAHGVFLPRKAAI